MLACLNNDSKMVRYLIEVCGADVNESSQVSRPTPIVLTKISF